MGVQTQVNIQLAAGFPGELYDHSPNRSAPWELVSSSAAYNIIGATAFTATTADTGAGNVSGIAAAGGTGQFVGILTAPKQNSTFGTSTGALNPTLTLPNYSIGQLSTMGHWWATLPGTANVGDQVAYDATTGAITTYPKTASFTATLTKATGVLNVSAIAAGFLQPGMIVSGVGFAGVTIVEYGSALGGTGTYYTNALGIIASDISSSAMTAPMVPPPAAAYTVTGITTAGVMTVTTLASGQIMPGQVVIGTGIPPNTVIQPYGTNSTSGEGAGSSTYQVFPAPAVAVTGSISATSDLQIKIERAEVILFAPAGNGSLGVISLTGA